MTIHRLSGHYVGCDLFLSGRCDASWTGTTPEDALAGAVDAGWRELGDGRHVCPVCWEKRVRDAKKR